MYIDDYCRVELKEIDGVEGSDYINASYIDVSPLPIAIATILWGCIANAYIIITLLYIISMQAS